MTRSSGIRIQSVNAFPLFAKRAFMQAAAVIHALKSGASRRMPAGKWWFQRRLELPEALWAGLSRRFRSAALGKGNRRRQRRAEAKRLNCSSALIQLPGCAGRLINIRLDLINKLGLYNSQFQVYEFI